MTPKSSVSETRIVRNGRAVMLRTAKASATGNLVLKSNPAILARPFRAAVPPGRIASAMRVRPARHAGRAVQTAMTSTMAASRSAPVPILYWGGIDTSYSCAEGGQHKGRDHGHAD